MKKINYIYKSACLFGLLAVGMASCDDYLTIYPTDRVVEENFWEDANDLRGVQYGAYRQMASTVGKMFIWGDLRSDSYSINNPTTAQGTHDRYSNILNGMPDSSMSEFDWGGVYTTINLCNKVLKHGPEILEKDKQFTTTEWIYMRAEMKALRALNYFYLIRAFKDVPYTTKVISSDKEVESFPLSNQLAILDSIILDCESVAGQARNRFADNRDTKGMITNAAIYSMLADMYLWRGSLHQGRNIKNDTVVAHREDGTIDSIPHTYEGENGDYMIAANWAQKALDAHHQQVQEYLNSQGAFATINEIIDYGLSGVDLIKNNFKGASTSAPTLAAQNAIFNNGNSIESILEIQYSNSDGTSNSVVHSLFGYNDGTQLKVAEDAMKNAHCNNENNQKYDSRLWIGCQTYINDTQAKSGYFCLKYQKPTITWEGSSGSRKVKYASIIRALVDDYNNWIIYRTTDVMLMKAEALACAKLGYDNDVMNLVNAVNRRSFCDFNNETKPEENFTNKNKTTGNIQQSSDIIPNSKNSKISLPTIPKLVATVMNERQIELLGEGKRWFDLVRMAERYSNNEKDPADERENPAGVEKGDPRYVGNGQTGMAAVVYYFMKNSVGEQSCGTLYNRFKNRWGLYCPIYYEEVKASEGKILQNPVWNKSRYEQ
ncbi:MAG: RagB/SusD family nutrient uptake outer membrane protein [Bacteroidaceae bacterium]|nr:RagB/SusD family nutrient uptake outer membrane protein [Bacteroidaceae bacterium]